MFVLVQGSGFHLAEEPVLSGCPLPFTTPSHIPLHPSWVSLNNAFPFLPLPKNSQAQMPGQNLTYMIWISKSRSQGPWRHKDANQKVQPVLRIKEMEEIEGEESGILHFQESWTQKWRRERNWLRIMEFQTVGLRLGRVGGIRLLWPLPKEVWEQDPRNCAWGSSGSETHFVIEQNEHTFLHLKYVWLVKGRIADA